MDLKTLQPSFTGGEISPSLYSRVDLQKYASGLRTARNFIIHPAGGASNRPGTQFIATAKNAAKKCRLVPFEFSLDQAYVLEFGDGYIRVFAGGAPVNVQTGFSEFDATRSYVPGDYVKISPQVMFWATAGAGMLTVTPPSSQTTDINTTIDVNTVDTLSVTTSGSGPAIHLANTTPAKNSAALIQAAVRAANAAFLNWTVTEDAVYAAARPVTVPGGYAIFRHASFYNYPTGYFLCRTAVAGNANNTSSHPSLTVLNTPWENMQLLEVPAPYLEADLGELKFTQSADVLYITHPKYAPRMLVRYAEDRWRLETFTFTGGPFMPSNSEATKKITPSASSGWEALKNIIWAETLNPAPYYVVLNVNSHGYITGDTVKIEGSGMAAINGNQYTVERLDGDWFYLCELGTRNRVSMSSYMMYGSQGTTSKLLLPVLTASFNAFASGHEGSLWKLVHQIEGQKAYYTKVASEVIGANLTSIQCGGTWRITTRGTWAGSIQLEKSLDAGITWLTVRGFSSSSDFNVNTYGEMTEPCLLRVRCTAYTSGSINVDLTADAYEHTGIFKITAIISATQASATAIKSAGAVTATSDWAEGSWSEVNGWPRAVCFYQDRLCFAGTRNEAQTLWLSKTGEYNDFGRGTPLVDSDGVTITLSSRKMNGIRNLVSLNSILAFTNATEWSIGPGSGAAVTPTSAEVRCQGYRGSSNIDPLVIGNRGLFFQPMGAILRDFGYDFSADGYTGDDLTIFSGHLFDRRNIVGMAYAQEPDSQVWCVRDDGALLSLTYMKEQEVLAWSRHDTDGLFESVCSIPGAGYNEVWFVVKRTVNGATVRYIERLAQRMTSTDVKDQYFVDSGKTVALAPAGVNVTGLGHLEGKAVAVLADGNVVKGLTVLAGAITLPTAAEKVHAGLPFVADFETLNIELNLNTGTTQGSKVKLSDIILRFQNSRGGLLGANFTETKMDEVNNKRTTELLDDPIMIKSVDHKQLMGNSGYTEGGRICYRQKDPLPVTILAVIPTVNVGG